MAENKIEGVVPVMLTPMTGSGGIDFAGLERLIEWSLDKGAHFCSMKITQEVRDFAAAQEIDEKAPHWRRVWKRRRWSSLRRAQRFVGRFDYRAGIDLFSSARTRSFFDRPCAARLLSTNGKSPCRCAKENPFVLSPSKDGRIFER